ncbi:hypothetical protein [Cognatishimia activa]|uniref:hypothetical protein n=1 Tax=Cognatishimia activa TaxID=1715691 RepID=UPI00222E21F9|nr:hypothetical protein [Cognatishimia activa]UZD91682.1 hypothetical protein M0D42_03430 [Cognatishimia activa]
MDIKELVERAQEIATKISDTSGDERFALHDQLHRTLELIKLRGGKVPSTLHRLDLDLVDEAVEAAFDNVPV